MNTAGVSTEEARKKMWMYDVKGLITKSRTDLNAEQKPYAKEHAESNDLLALIKDLKPSALIGASTQGGAFTPEILKTMAAQNKRPIIFALSNPTPKAECTAQQAYDHTEGRAVYASGSPFPPVEFNGKKYYTGQGNNSYIFPGVALSIIVFGIMTVPEELFLIAAQCVADQVTDEELAEGRLYPNLKNVTCISVDIAARIGEYAYCKQIATLFPKPKDLRAYVEQNLYNTEYRNLTLDPWKWPVSQKDIDEKEITILQAWTSKS